LSINPGYADAYQLLGLIAIERAQYADAERLISCAIERDPQQSVYYFSHGLALRSCGRLDEALTAYERSLQLNPGFAEAHNNRGNALKIMGRSDEALAAYECAIRLKPECALFHNNRGSVLIILGRLEEALAAYERAVEINPAFAEAHCSRGKCLSVSGRLSEAAEAFRLAMAHDPTLVDAKYYLAALGEAEAPPLSPREHVIREFDEFADHFDNRLLNDLGYKIPQHLFDAVNKQRKQTKQIDILDLGCGTGLSGATFSGIASQLVGVDLAPRMLAKAEERNIYTDLIEADICHAMKQVEQTFDLVISADVFVYIGALEEVFSLVRQRLNPGGLFAFSIELLESDMDYQLRPTGRYAQSHAYIKRLSIDNNFEEVSGTLVTVRYEGGKPVTGSVFVFRMGGGDHLNYF
jgi:predicted TPR repeat methyltransferase